MKVLFITIGTIGTASTRARVYSLLPMLQAAGIETRVVLAPRGRSILKSPIWGVLFWPDVIVVQKALLSPLIRTLLGLTQRPRIYEINDALFAIPAYIIPSEVERTRMAQQTNAMLRWADVVCLNNGYLEEYARRFNPSVVTIPEFVDCTKFSPTTDARRKEGVPVLGWVGAADKRHFENVKLLAEPLAKLAQKRSLVLRLIGMREDERFTKLFESIRGLRVETVGWRASADHVPHEIRQLDVGLAPLIEDPWTLGKSPVKVLEYMACGVLPVASAVGQQKEFIKDGVNGFLVNTTQEWVEKLEYAISDAPELDTMRQRAVETIRSRYSVEVCGQQVLEMLFQASSMSQDDLRRQRLAR